MRTPRNSKLMRLAILAAVLAAAFIVVFSTRGRAQPASAPAAAPAAASNPAMWVVRDRDTTIYLFGTFHIMDADQSWFDDEVREAFESSRELVLEADIPADPARAEAQLAPLIARYAVDPRGQTISSRLTPEQNRTLAAAMASIDMPPGRYERMEPWFINTLIPKAFGKRMGAGLESGADTVLRRAAGRRMQLRTLETPDFQFRMFDSFPEENQLAQLKLALDNWDAIGTQLPRMLNVWKRGDAEGLDRILNAALRGDPVMRRVLLEDRNRAWAEWIVNRLRRPGTVFMAVGAGHLVGPGSVQEVLRERGIESSRVPSGERLRAYPPCRGRTDDRCSQRN